MKYLRFDIKSTRTERLKTDKFALISEVWNKFILDPQTCYNPGAYITVDEQLFLSKTRYPYLQFMTSKPDKYSQKVWLAVDKDSNYTAHTKLTKLIGATDGQITLLFGSYIGLRKD